jgi:hypothetical protein
VDEAVLGNEVNDSVLFGHLHGDREIICGFGREVNVNCLLDECGIWGLVINFDDVQLKEGRE